MKKKPFINKTETGYHPSSNWPGKQGNNNTSMFDLNIMEAKYYKFESLRDRIIAEIAVGHLKAHSKLPTVPQICKSCNLSPMTVGRALMHLRKKGYIHYMPGKGYFVKAQESYPEYIVA